MSENLFATRREFVRQGLSLLSGAATVPLFIEQTARAFDRKPNARADDRVLVVLQMAGGNDGLNTVIPYRNDLYYRARPQLAVARADALRLTDELGLHPAATGLKQLYDDGLLAIVQGVGYPNPDRSHFRSTEIWETADPRTATHTGWLGRYFDCTCKGADRPDPKRAIALTQEAPPALVGERFSPVAFSEPQQLSWHPGRVSRGVREVFAELNGEAPASGTAAIDYLRRTALDARLSARQIQDAAGGKGRAARGRMLQGGRGGGQLAQQLQTVARMIAAELPTRVYYVSLSGFDTHAGQVGRHQQLMGELGEALSEFFADLRASGHLERVLLMTFSEFGRRVAQNASQGTDHGTAAPLFLAGAGVRPGLHGKHPSLSKLDAGDLIWGIDFRSVYANVLTRWLPAGAREIIPGSFANLELLHRS